MLTRGILQSPSKCPSRFSVYTPYDLSTCSSVVILCHGAHNHSNPIPVKTPPPIADVLETLLLELDWKLADATPRRVVVDSGFIGSLRKYLEWSRTDDPSLSNLHPSLGNQDHVRRYITNLRKVHFPNGTGFDGMLCDCHSLYFN